MAINAEVRINAKDNTRQAFAAVKRNIEGVEHSLRHFKTELFAIVGVAGLGALMESALESGAEIEKLSKKLGASTEALSQFKHVAELSHVSFESLTKGWQFLEKNVAAASKGLGTARTAFESLGLSASRLKQLRPEDQFEILADAFTQVHNASDRTRLAMQIFGKAGAEMIPVMTGGSAAIRAAREEADRLGLTLNETAAHHLAGAHEAMVRLKSAVAGAANTLAVGLGPSLAWIANLLSVSLPPMVHLSVLAFIRFKETVALAISTVLAALENLYGAVGHLPGVLGEPFREASRAAKAFRDNMFEAVSGYEKEITHLNALDTSRRQAIQHTAQTYAELYDPALNSMRVYQKKFTQHQSAMDQATRQALKTQEKLAEEQTQKISGILSGGLLAGMEEGLKGMVSSFKNALKVMASEAAAAELTRGLLGGFTGFSVNKAPSFLSTVMGSLFGGFKASGGPVTAGKGYIVGERGPEYFMPRQHGEIIPHHALKVSSPPTIIMHIHTPDAPSFQHSRGQITRGLTLALQQAGLR